MCWIDAVDIDDAVARARAEIIDEGFIPDPEYDVYVVTREDYLEDPEGLEYFDQAVIDKEVCAFYTYPVDDVEA